MDKSKIIDLVGAELYQNTAAWAREAAPETDSMKQNYRYPFSSDLPHTIVNYIDADKPPESEAMSMLFSFYEDMPCYGFLMYAKLNFLSAQSQTQTIVWDHYRRYLAGLDEALAQPVCYSLWCDFFEDPRTVQIAWEELVLTDPSDLALERILEHSGPVPFEQKNQLYTRLLPEPRWHIAIFHSLLFSAFDVYGQIEVERAREILGRLQLPASIEDLDELRRKLDS